MNAREMHYDYKQKLNKVDSQKYRNLQVPEIDWKLQEAQEIFVKVIAQPRLRSQLGFEINQRVIDDIRSIVINQIRENNNCLEVTSYDSSSFIATLPQDYWFFIGGNVFADKGKCKDIKLKVREVQHDDEQDASPFDRSSFEWRISNLRFIKDGVRIFTDGTYSITKLCMNYIKKPRKIHNAQDYQGGTYLGLDGVTYTGSQSCELPEMVHKEIVDLAVLITAGNLAMPTYNLMKDKINLTT